MSEPTSSGYNVLLVDDSPTSRIKLAAAVRHLGHDVIEADGGITGLAAMQEDTVHLVLLDILMPDMDGFAVLREMRLSTSLSEIPVLVISSIEDMTRIVEAIDLGAVDFLPKNVDPKLLKARVDSCLEKKRLRDLELAYLQDVNRLTNAAQTVKESDFNPASLQIDEVVARKDTLGDLARVFREMASDVHRREVAFRRQIDLLRGGFLLILLGVLTGLYPALSKILVGTSINNPIGMTAWVAVVTMGFGFTGLLASRTLPTFTWSKIKFALIIGPFAGAFPQIGLFLVSEHIPAVVLSITLAMQALMVFAITALLGIEKPSLRRFGGLVLGMIAVGIVILPSSSGDGMGASFWILVAMLVPLSYAIEGILLGGMPDQNTGPMELVFFTMLGSAAWAWSASLVMGNILLPSELDTTRITMIVMIGAISGSATWLLAIAIRKTGAIFASQYGYVTTIMGVLWSLVLLDETTTRWIWLSLAFMIAGMVLVRPRESDELAPPKSKATDKQVSTATV